jgi:uncharacterized repeat protein (TIGR01451 family)
MAVPRRSRRALSCAAVLVALISGLIAAPAAQAAGNNPLSVSISAPSSVPQGTDMTATIVVENTGGATMTEVTMTDTISGLSGGSQGWGDQNNPLVITSTVGTCLQTGNEVRCDIGQLAGRQAATITIRGVVTASEGTTINNTADATGTKSATTFTSSATTSTFVTAGSGGTSDYPDLAMSIKAPVSTPPSHDVVFTATINNLGGVKASDIEAQITLPDDVDYITSTATNLFECSGPAPHPDTQEPILTCSGGAINAGASATIQVGAVTPPFEGPITASAAVDPYDAIIETDELNNFAQATTQVGYETPAETLAIDKTANVSTLAPGEQLVYTIVVENTTPDRADYIEIVDGTTGLEASSIQVDWSYSGNMQKNPVPLDCVVAASKVTCTTTRFQPGQIATIDITGTVVAPPGTTIINSATVNANIRNTGLTNTSAAITTVKPARDLSVTMHRVSPVKPDPVRAADLFQYEITVGNSGLYDANNVLVRLPLPAGPDDTTTKDDVVLDLSEGDDDGIADADGFLASDAGTTCSVDADNVLTCVIPAVAGVGADSPLPGGTTETILLYLIAPHQRGPITSTVTVDPQNAIAEHDEANNTDTLTTQVLTGVDLTIEKTQTPNNVDLDADGTNDNGVARNGELSYFITVTNLGTQDTGGVVIRDELPEGVVFRSAAEVPTGPVPGHNFSCGFSNGVVECVGGVIDGTYSGHLRVPQDSATIEIRTFAPDEPGSYENLALVDPYGAIPEISESNNVFGMVTNVVNVSESDPTKYSQYKELSIPVLDAVADGSGHPFATSGVLDYDLSVINQGTAKPGATDNVVIRITLPTGSIYRDAYDKDFVPGDPAGAFVCSYLGGQIVECTGGTVDPGAGRGIRIETFAPAVQGQAHLQAIVDPNNAIAEADELNNTNDELTLIQAGEITEVQGTYIDLKPSICVTKDEACIVGPAEAGTSSLMHYFVTVSNPGEADAFDVRFRATLPAGSRFDQANDRDDTTPPLSDAFHCTHAGADVNGYGGVVTCEGGRVDGNNGARVVDIAVFAPAQPSSGGTQAHLQVEVDPENAIPEGHEGNNTADHFTDVKIGGPGSYIDLQVDTSTFIPDASKAPSGDIILQSAFQYHIDVYNTGSADALNVVVRDPLPPSVQFVSVETDVASNFLCTNSSGVLTCTGGYLPGDPTPGDAADQTHRIIKVNVISPNLHDRTLVNQVSVDPDNAIPENSEVNNLSQVSNKVVSVVDFKVSISGGPGTQGTEGDVVWSIENTGSGDADYVVVKADLSDGLTHIDTSPTDGVAATKFACQVTENPVNGVICTGSLAAGEMAEFTSHVYRASSDSLTNWVYADPGDAVVEGNSTGDGETNNTDSDDI